MPQNTQHGPAGGLQAHARGLRGWRWDHETLVSSPVRCKRGQWYLARARARVDAQRGTGTLCIRFRREEELIGQQRTELAAITAGEFADLLGWFKTPEDATHLQLELAEGVAASAYSQVVLHPVAERDPKCHPLANVPRWGQHRPPFPLQRVVLPESLACLSDHLSGRKVDILPHKVARRKLFESAVGAACILDPDWVIRLGLDLGVVEELAASCWLLADLETLAALVFASGHSAVRVVRRSSRHQIMSARVEYSDVATRGFALQDVLPFATTDDGETFSTRVWVANRAWKKFAEAAGFATLLASETPFEELCGDVLSAARPVGRGELIATDLPWLVAGKHGTLLAPRLAQHLLQTHLGGEVEDSVQYWNRWDESAIVVRDIADLAKRCPPLRTLRWASDDPALARLGIHLPARDGNARGPHLTFQTGRVDNLAAHDGLPPEPMVIFMKWLARERREQSAWARRFLADCAVTWQFDTRAGVRYAVLYDSAEPLAEAPTQCVAVQAFGAKARGPAPGAGPQVTIQADVGILGDGSLRYQAELTRRLCRAIERFRSG